MITKEQLSLCAKGLNPRDFTRFAERVSALDGVCGAMVRKHAEIADGNSPDLLPAWVDGAIEDDAALSAANIGQTPEIAKAWWEWTYADGPSPITNILGEVI